MGFLKTHERLHGIFNVILNPIAFFYSISHHWKDFLRFTDIHMPVL